MDFKQPPPPPKGRPRKDATAVSAKRAEQNRIAANNYRQKKDNRIKELELRVAVLEKENQVLRKAVLDSTGSLAVLEGLVGLDGTGGSIAAPVVMPDLGNVFQQQQQQQQPIIDFGFLSSLTDTTNNNINNGIDNNQNSLVNSSPSFATDSWIDVRAVELFGPPQVLSTRFALKDIPSLKDSKLVDELLDLFLLQAECTNTTEIRKYLVRILKLRNRVLAKCTLEDRVRAIEVFELCKVLNRSHVMHLYETGGMDCDFDSFWNMDSPGSNASSSRAGTTSTALSPNVLAFRQAAISLAPSVQNASSTLDQLCEVFMTQATISDHQQREEQWFKSKELENKLLDACGLEDRKKLAIVFEQWRDQNKAHESEFLEEA